MILGLMLCALNMCAVSEDPSSTHCFGARNASDNLWAINVYSDTRHEHLNLKFSQPDHDDIKVRFTCAQMPYEKKVCEVTVEKSSQSVSINLPQRSALVEQAQMKVSFQGGKSVQSSSIYHSRPNSAELQGYVLIAPWESDLPVVWRPNISPTGRPNLWCRVTSSTHETCFSSIPFISPEQKRVCFIEVSIKHDSLQKVKVTCGTCELSNGQFTNPHIEKTCTMQASRDC